MTLDETRKARASRRHSCARAQRLRQILQRLRAHRLTDGIEQSLADRGDRSADLQVCAIAHACSGWRWLEMHARIAGHESEPTARVDLHGIALRFDLVGDRDLEVELGRRDRSDTDFHQSDVAIAE